MAVIDGSGVTRAFEDPPPVGVPDEVWVREAFQAVGTGDVQPVPRTRMSRKKMTGRGR